MSITDPMTVDERRKYLHKMRIRYWQVKDRTEKSRLVSEMVTVTGLHRKSILRLLHGDLARKPRVRQRGPTYGTEVIDTVRTIVRSLDYPCAERLQPNLVWMADQFIQHGELVLSLVVREKLAQVSLSTVRRIVPPHVSKPERIAYRCGPQAAARHIPANIPMRRIPHQEPQPGHFEVDLVHHCGMSASGQYVHTLQMTDVTTGWCEPVATLWRSYLVMRDGFECIQQRLPFSILELHPDNGSEFLNDLMLRFWGQVVPQANLSRSRPYHKNDNRFVEENNYSLVQAYLGYQRLDTVAQTILLNQLYDKLWFYHNFFQPVMRLVERGSVSDPSHHIQRIYDNPQPPSTTSARQVYFHQNESSRYRPCGKLPIPARSGRRSRICLISSLLYLVQWMEKRKLSIKLLACGKVGSDLLPTFPQALLLLRCHSLYQKERTLR